MGRSTAAPHLGTIPPSTLFLFFSSSVSSVPSVLQLLPPLSYSVPRGAALVTPRQILLFSPRPIHENQLHLRSRRRTNHHQFLPCPRKRNPQHPRRPLLPPPLSRRSQRHHRSAHVGSLRSPSQRHQPRRLRKSPGSRRNLPRPSAAFSYANPHRQTRRNRSRRLPPAHQGRHRQTLVPTPRLR